jgi:hypothetical protein
MKKLYKAPETVAIFADLSQNLLENSIPLTSNPATTDDDGNYETLSRHNNIWEDEDLDDF